MLNHFYLINFSYTVLSLGIRGENSTTPDIYVVGLEEIIDLNASNIVNAR